MTRESARAEESSTSPELTKGPSVTKCVRRIVGAWGWRKAPRGLWFSLNGPGVASIPSLAAELRRRMNPVERPIRSSGSREAERRRCQKSLRSRRSLSIARPVTEKVPEQSGKD